MEINPGIFKAYDIRGIYGTELSEEVAYRLGKAYVELRREDGLQNDLQIVVGEDMRLSSPQLKESLIKGLTEAGANVIDIGLASTPTFYFAVANYNYDGGIIVSASHNPGEYNGFKITRSKAIPVSGETGMMILRDKVIANNFTPSDKIGQVIKKDNVLQDQIAHDLQFGNLQNIKPIKIAIDTANSMGAQYLDELFKHLPCELIKMNWELDGTFPAHEADPLKEENLEDLKKKVLETSSDFGITTDGDGDRIFFVDNEGQAIDQAIIRGILSMIFLKEKPGSKICYDIRPGKITQDLIEENGGIPIVTRVGHSLIKEQTLKEGAYFAGESSGHFFLNMPIGCFEVPVIVTLKLLEYFSQSGQTVAETVKPFKRYFHSGEINSVVADKDIVIATLIAKYPDGQLNRLDGITIEYPDFWFNVRGSNTEPKLRLNLEARTKEIMEVRRDEVLGIIRA
ncbi:phosphomannomutase/phosphoglucomutase [Candidatus Parcubacteria bacterium]|nr:phosphomannomutase/phosphoglucomutase [Patescibacteria group bacterium]MBU4309895.1 phosphomannomutase/phosphoglucomutase [Patescibacteria group bacterium]MBU4431903.1 phosphomannomutase/phosphoglucomutase [Patescibacteria group bacterium]MBU4578234.1 phosphomannomutase/phosphoglucomutase [Patescibacteria group bacterium]MCG2696770.1 phosphomannomutase/phosphoglucomutase [Candidatus Parcubacteria bacterium]